MGSLNPNNPLFYDHEILLRSLGNLSLNNNNNNNILDSNAARWYSTTLASSSNNLRGNTFTSAGSCCGSPSSCPWNCWNVNDRRSQDGNNTNMAQNQIENTQFCSPWNQDNVGQNCNFTRPRNHFLETATTRNGSLFLQRTLREENNPLGRQQIFDGICGSIFEVMANEYGHHLFQRLLDVCDSRQLNVIFLTLASNEKFFTDVALLKHGSTAVQTLIKKLKRSDLGYRITSILSKRFVELMTGEQGRYVVQQCFNTFKPKENEVLYNHAVIHFKELATTEHGCASLNACLNCISGVQRVALLAQISEHSDFLANHPWGHFVVQHVLWLKDENFTRIICVRLKNQFLNLAHRKGGSHVVEKCITSSDFGMRSVVEALLKSQKGLHQLASDQFGNYVVQTALKETKRRNLELYRSLVMVLKTRNSDLSRNVIGRHIVNLIKELEGSSVEN